VSMFLSHKTREKIRGRSARGVGIEAA
jgi:hypothetical protein